MKTRYIDSMEALYVYENKYKEELIENHIQILRDIKISKSELNDISKHINILFRTNNMKSLKYKFPITLSLFLVWCTVYEYKDGDMWSNIFEKLNIVGTTFKRNFFGNIFLDTINSYNLIEVKEGEGKKFLSPILMHGYISNHYAYDLFNYLNKIYSIVLEEDTSEDAINNIWDDIFIEDVEFINIKKERILLENKKKGLLNKINDNYEIDDEIKNITYDYVKELESEVNDLEEIIESNKRKIETIGSTVVLHEKVNDHFINLNSSISKLFSKSTIYINIEDLEELNVLVDEVRYINQSKKDLLRINKDKLIKGNKGLYNKLAVKKETLVSIKTKISTLGQGALDKGWIVLEEYSELKEELRKTEIHIKNIKKLENVAELEQNTTIKQILTASLYNLRISCPECFKNFIITTIQMMGSYFAGDEIDDTHPLYDVFLEWYKGKPEKNEYTGVIRGKQSETTSNNKRKRLILQSFKKPYIQLDTTNFLLNIIIPEQSFSVKKSLEIEPYYSIIDKKGSSFGLEINYVYYGENLYIKEKVIPIHSDTYDYLFVKWYNLRELHDVSLATIMVFDESGTLLDRHKIKNGYYFIVCDKSWSLDKALVLSEHELSFENYKVVEVYLNETKARFYRKDNNETYEIVATNYDNCYLDKYEPIEGVYVKNTPVITGMVPELLINYIGLDPSAMYLRIYLNNNLVFNRELSYLIETNSQADGDSKLRINIYKLLKLGKSMTAFKLKIILSYIGKEPFLKEEFYYLPRTQFKYKNGGLNIRISMGMRFYHRNYKQKGTEYWIPLKNKEGEYFKIYYDKYGWMEFWVEVPHVTAKIFDEKGNEYNNKDILYGSKRDRIKNLFVHWETESKKLKSILLFDNNHYLETRAYIKNGKAKTSISSYFDMLSDIDEGKLSFISEGNNISMEEEILLKTYNKWKVYDIEVQQKEEKDEYILGITYDENFTFKDAKYLEIINDGRIIIKKLIKNQIYIYIKKRDLTSNCIKVNIVYNDEYESIFGRVEDTIVAGTADIELKSKINEVEKILNNGLILTEFKYFGKMCTFKYPIHLERIKKAYNKNFEGEEMYMANVSYSDSSQEVYFYIDTDKKILPFLVDKENDGAQYNPKNGQVFWEFSNDSNIMAPVENIKYVIKEES